LSFAVHHLRAARGEVGGASGLWATAAGWLLESGVLLGLGRTSRLRRVRLENPLGHGNFLSGLKLSGERDGGLGLARFSAVCPLDGHMCANGL
jgi:hypothetical protein